MALRPISLPAVLLLLAFGPPPKGAAEQPAQQIRNFRKAVLEAPGDIQALLKDPAQVLLFGEVGLAKDEFPANRWYDYMCGGTLVSDNVLITAAHCVFSDNIIVVLVSGTPAMCDHDPQYTTAGREHDVAACLTHDAIHERLYETVDLLQTAVAIKDPIMLTGFAGNASSPSGVDLMGRTTLESINGGVLVTRGGAWIGKGDSGSSDYSWKPPVNRRLIAVNSDLATGTAGSTLSSLVPSRSFLSDWARQNRTHICGLNGFTSPLCRP